VEKQRRVRNNPTLFSDKNDPGSVPIAGFWNTAEPQKTGGQPTQETDGAGDELHGANVLVRVPRKSARPVAIGMAGEH